MRKEFTQARRDYLRGLLAKIRAEDESFGILAGVADGIGDALGAATMAVLDMLGLSDSLKGVEWYQKMLYDTCNTTEAAIDKAFEDVCAIDAQYVSNTDKHRAEYYAPIETYLSTLIYAIDPTAGALTGSRVNQMLDGLAANLPRVSSAYSNPGADSGFFGGDQGGYKYREYEFSFRQCADIVRSYPRFSSYTDQQVRKFLDDMNSEGCPYVAWTNTLFEAFEGREEEFESVFGFPMYDANGRPNFGLLIVDFYCAQDDRSKTNGTSTYTGLPGHSRTEAAKLWGNYMRDKGIYATITEDLTVTPDNYERVKQNGQLVVATSPIRLRDGSGVLVDTRDGGHTMAIVGITDDGLLIVSSWGGKYYIDPNDYRAGMTFIISRVEY